MPKGKHNLAGDAKEIRQREKNEKKLECAERRQYGSCNLYQVLSLWWSNRLKIQSGWSRRRRFLRQALKKKKHWDIVVQLITRQWRTSPCGCRRYAS